MYKNRQLIALVGLAVAATILAFAFPVTAAPLVSPPRLQPALWIQTSPSRVTPVIQASSGQVLPEGDGGIVHIQAMRGDETGGITGDPKV